MTLSWLPKGGTCSDSLWPSFVSWVWINSLKSGMAADYRTSTTIFRIWRILAASRMWSLGVMRDNETDPTGAFQAVLPASDGQTYRFPRCHFNQRQALPFRSTSICCPIPRHPECWKPCAGVPWEVIRVFPALSSIWTASANRLANPWLTRRSQGSPRLHRWSGTTVASLGPGCPRRLFPMGISSF